MAKPKGETMHGRPERGDDIHGHIQKGIEVLVNSGDLPDVQDTVELLGDPGPRDYLIGELLSMTTLKEAHVGAVSAEWAHIMFWNDRVAALRLVRWLQVRAAIKGERANMVLKMIMGAQAKVTVPTTMQRFRTKMFGGRRTDESVTFDTP